MTATVLDGVRRRRSGETVLLGLVAGYVLVFCVVPLLRLFAEAFVLGAEGAADTFGRVLGASRTWQATWHTLEAGLGATAVSLVLGTVIALLVGLTDLRWKSPVVFLAIMPLLIPAQIAALAWLELLGPSSFLYDLVGYDFPAGQRNPLYSREGVMLLMGIEHAPMVFLAVRAGLRALPADQVEAARAAGAGPLRIVGSVLLPMLRPSLVAGGALAFVSAIGNFGVPALLGIPAGYTMLTTLVYQRLNGFGITILGQVAVLAMILAAIAAIGLAIQAWGLSRRNQAIERAAALGTAFTLGRWRWPIEAAVWAVLLMIGVLPLIALASTSVVQALGVPLSWETWTFDHYREVFADPMTGRAFQNSLMLALLAAVFSVLVSVPLSYLTLTRRRRLARVLDLLADAPYALPGIVLAIAVILILLPPLPGLGISLYNSFWILLFAYLGRFLALGLRPTAAGVQSVEPALEEAARLAGAGSLRRLRAVVFPLAAPSAAAGGILVFMAAFNELTVSALLWSAGNETLGVVVFSLYDGGDSTAAAAVAVLSVLATLVLAGLAGLVARFGKLPQGVLPWQA